MLFFCKHCSGGLSGIGRTNCFVCYKCKTAYEVEIKITELPRRNADAILRQHALPAGNPGDTEDSAENDGFGGPVSPGEEKFCPE